MGYPEETASAKELKVVPVHVAIIMDGNGRWAQQRGLPRTAGHRAGTENIRTVLQAAVDFGIQYLTLFAFSTENWGRPAEEVRALMMLLEQVIDRELAELHAKGVRLRHLGRLDALPSKLQEKIQHALELTKDNTRISVNIAFNYGGRMEIVEAVRRMMHEGVRPDEVTEETLSKYLFTAGLPDPDLIIRTAGEMRLSNFLIWQAAYAEYYSTPTYWPDFGREELYKALLAYAQRDRRFGLLKPAS
ncbi:MAG: isoprenyl transferase [Chloroflexi bacterium]|nr:isoprenyl transferase [Chloroflexota bacterium]